MGNSISKSTHNNKYVIDYETIDIQTQPNGSKDQKIYYIVNREKKYKQKVIKLTIKIIDENILIYTKDPCEKNDDELIYVSKIFVNTRDDAQMIEHYMKFIQISQDFKSLSIPEFDTVNVYNLVNCMKHLEYMNTIGIKFDLNQDTNCLTTTINDQTTDPLKCILCTDALTIICRRNNIMIVTFNYVNNNCTVTNIENTKHNDVNLSLNGKYAIWYDDNKYNVCDIFTEKCESFSPFQVKQQAMIINRKKIPDCISGDGKIVMYGIEEKENEKIIYDTRLVTSQCIKLFVYPHSHPRNANVSISITKYYLKKTDQQITNASTEKNDVYVLIGWDQSSKKYYYWLIHMILGKIKVSEMWTMSCDDHHKDYHKDYHKIDYIHHNGNTFIYKTTNRIIMYELDKIIPIKYVEMLSHEYYESLKKLYNNNYQKKSYYQDLEILAADDSTRIYDLDNMMKFMLLLHTEHCDTNKFQLRVTSNINIYDTTKSFDIFQKLLLKQINGSEIIEKIFATSESEKNGIHNMMFDLMMHFYEYIRVIILKELDTERKKEISEFDLNVLLYIGYTLLSLVLKYYLALSKTRDQDIIKYDIIEIFIENFPLFEQFIGQAVTMMVKKN
jgi:hypothetical protein